MMPSLENASLDGAVVSEHVFVLRWLSNDRDRLLVVNLGAERFLSTVPVPLLAPPTPLRWSILWSSEDAAYGGAGTAPVENADGWRIPGQAAVLLAPCEA